MSDLSTRVTGEVRALLILAGPLIVSRVGMVTMGIVDTMVAGRVGTDAMASLALGSSAYFVLLIFAMGTLMGMEPVVAAAVGGDSEGDRVAAFRSARWMAVALGIPVIGSLFVIPHFLRALGEPEALLPGTASYLWGLAPGVIPALLFSVAAGYLSSTSRNRVLLWIAIGANVVNLVLDLVFGLGWLGAQAHGVRGIGMSTAGCNLFSWLAAVAVMAGPGFKRYAVAWGRPTRAMVKRILKIGLPVGTQYAAEMGAFGVVTFWMGLQGVEEVAGNQIAFNIIGATFTAALGLSVAASVRVGYGRGAGDAAAVRLAGWTALGVGAIYAMLAGAGIYATRTAVTGLYTDDAEVIALARYLLGIAVFFQLADALQAIGFGVLRGMEDTVVPAVFNIVGYWLLGLPLGYWWGFHVWPGPGPIWWGLSVSLYVIAIALGIRFWRLSGDKRLKTRPG